MDSSLASDSDYFTRFDSVLDKASNGPYWLQQDEIASVVADSLHFNHNKEYDLWSFNIMPNHVHVVLSLLEHSQPLYRLLQKHKRFTARQCNKLLQRDGSFWTPESYDHIIRNGAEFNRIVAYTLYNAVNAGFVKKWSDWKWAYIHPELRGDYDFIEKKIG